MEAIYNRYIDWSAYPNLLQEENVNDDMKAQVAILSISICLLVMYWIQTVFKKQNVGYSHFLLTIWILTHVFPIYNLSII